MSTDPNDTTNLTELGTQHWGAATSAMKKCAGDELAQVMDATRRDLSKAHQTAAALSDTIERTMGDDTLPHEARQRIAREKRTEATEAIKAAGERVDTTLTVARQKLAQKALPALPDDPRQIGLLRDELKMIMDASDDPYAMATAIAEGPDREAAAVIASSWGQRYLQSKGYEDTADVLRTTAIAGSARHGTKAQRAAGKALHDALIEAEKGRAAMLTAAGIKVENVPEF